MAPSRIQDAVASHKGQSRPMGARLNSTLRAFSNWRGFALYGRPVEATQGFGPQDPPISGLVPGLFTEQPNRNGR